jgi:hypothetical protein
MTKIVQPKPPKLSVLCDTPPWSVQISSRPIKPLCSYDIVPMSFEVRENFDCAAREENLFLTSLAIW